MTDVRKHLPAKDVSKLSFAEAEAEIKVEMETRRLHTLAETLTLRAALRKLEDARRAYKWAVRYFVLCGFVWTTTAALFVTALMVFIVSHAHGWYGSPLIGCLTVVTVLLFTASVILSLNAEPRSKALRDRRIAEREYEDVELEAANPINLDKSDDEVFDTTD